MKVASDIDEMERGPEGSPAILAIGSFDGVHRGHQYLLRQASDRAGALGFQSVVLTFEPLPEAVVHPEGAPPQLSDVEEKLDLIAAQGADACVMQRFTPQFAQLSAERFLERVLDHIDVREIWMGVDFAFGHRREGDVQFLSRAGSDSGFALHIVPRQRLNGLPISSTTIRRFILEGDVAAATDLLGYFPVLSGVVVAGAGRGKGLGFPTANVKPKSSHIVPRPGVYAGRIRAFSRRYPAALSVGYNPTFGANPLSIEAYILDFDSEPGQSSLRGHRVTLEFVERLRDEAKFDSPEELVEAMERDVARVREVLSENKVPAGETATSRV